MTFWIILAIMTSTAAALVAAPFIRRLDRLRAAPAGDIEVYRDQLQDVESRQRQGVIDEAGAAAARFEIVTRALAADRMEQPATPNLSARERNFTIICVSGIVILGSVGLFAAAEHPDRPSLRGAVAAQQAPATFIRDPSPPANVVTAMQKLASIGRAEPPPRSGLPPVDEMIQRLAARLQQNPNDSQGWRTLGWSYFNIGRFSDASDAYAKAIELNPEVAELRSARIEALVRSADGIVTADTRNAIEDTLKIDPKDARARYFAGLAKEQAGDETSALTDWREVLRDANPDETWVADLRNKIDQVEHDLGQDTAARPAEPNAAVAGGSPETSAAPTGSQMPPTVGKGPGPQEVRAAEAMAPANRSAMIRGMVDRLASRLEKSPRDADGWIKLMQSRMVLGETELAKQALVRGTGAFSDDTQQRDRIIAAAQQLGLTQ